MTEKERRSEQLKGAAIERAAILRKYRRINWRQEDAVADFERWILTRHDRYNKRKGGLGK